MNHFTPSFVTALAVTALVGATRVPAQESVAPGLIVPFKLTVPDGPLRALSPVNRADALYFSGDPRASFTLLDEYLKVSPNEYETLWRAARAAVILGVSMDGSRPQNRWLDPAMELADRAVALDPDGIDGLYWRGTAHGRRAMNASPGYATELAQRVYDDAHAILAQDSLHGGAHNLLGKLSYEVMSLSRFERAIGRVFLGNEALSKASWENAEHHLAAAAEAWPDLVLFQFDLARLHQKRDRDEDARAAFRRVLEIPAVHPPDFECHARAREALSELAP
jgi:tetratricopeptide (TPR) repeat protein